MDNLQGYLGLISVVADLQFNPQVLLNPCYAPVDKGKCYEVESLGKAKLKKLEEELKETKKKCTKLETEVLKLRCVTRDMQVDVVPI